MSRAILHAIEIKSDPPTLFDAISTQRGQTGFWTTDAVVEPTVGSVASFGFPGTTERMKMRIERLEPGRAVEWVCEGDYPGWAGTRLRVRCFWDALDRCPAILDQGRMKELVVTGARCGNLGRLA